MQQALQRLGRDTGNSLVGLEQTGILLTGWSLGGFPELAMQQSAFAQLEQEIGILSDLLVSRYFSVSEAGMAV